MNKKYEEAIQYAEEVIYKAKHITNTIESMEDYNNAITRLDLSHIAGLLILAKDNQDRGEYIFEADARNGEWLPELSARMLVSDSPEDKEDLASYIRESLIKYMASEIRTVIEIACSRLNPQWEDNEERIFKSLIMEMRG